MTVAVRARGTVHAGRAVDLRPVAVAPREVAAAVRGEPVPGVTVDCPPPGPFHDRVGVVEAGMCFERRPALAAAARTRGLTAPQDEAVATTEAALADLDPPPADAAAARRRVASAGEERDRLRERVARLQGRVRARRDAGLDAGDAEAALDEAARALSEAETERAAAEQALARARERARAARDVRERRLALEDRLANQRRAARAHLAAAVADEFAAAVAAAPGDATDAESASPRTAALAAARVADLDAPVVLVDPPFPDPATAADWLDVPVVQV